MLCPPPLPLLGAVAPEFPMDDARCSTRRSRAVIAVESSCWAADTAFSACRTVVSVRGHDVDPDRGGVPEGVVVVVGPDADAAGVASGHTVVAVVSVVAACCCRVSTECCAVVTSDCAAVNAESWPPVELGADPAVAGEAVCCAEAPVASLVAVAPGVAPAVWVAPVAGRAVDSPDSARCSASAAWAASDSAACRESSRVEVCRLARWVPAVTWSRTATSTVATVPAIGNARADWETGSTTPTPSSVRVTDRRRTVAVRRPGVEPERCTATTQPTMTSAQPDPDRRQPSSTAAGWCGVDVGVDIPRGWDRSGVGGIVGAGSNGHRWCALIRSGGRRSG